MFLGFLAGLQYADPNISSSALLTAGSSLGMGSLVALAASVSTFMLAATVITTGMFADRLGRRKVLIAALIVTALGDLLVFVAIDSWIFIAGRAAAGIGLGAVYGASFAYIKQFAKGSAGIAGAIAVWGGSALSVSLILSFSGASLVGLDWRTAFLLIPIFSMIAIPVTLLVLPRDRRSITTNEDWDVVAQLLLAFGIIGLLYGVSSATESLTAPQSLGPIALGCGLLVAFVVYEHHRGEAAMFPVGLFRKPIFAAAILAGLVFNLGNGALLLSFSNLFQFENGLSGMGVATAQLPYLFAMIAGIVIVGRLVGSGRMSESAAVGLGTVTLIVGLLIFAVTALGQPDSIWAYVPALAICGFGVILPSIPYGALVLAQADAQHLGVVSSSRPMIGQFWYAVGLSISTVVIARVTQTQTSAGTGRAEAFSVSFAVMAIGLAVVIALAGVTAALVIKHCQQTRHPSVHSHFGIAVWLEQSVEPLVEEGISDLSARGGHNRMPRETYDDDSPQ